ncbi:MAG TPA: hypothetical protein VHR45_03705 [Thermoanaerobaculia bacterium]|nr:hypothetical protein [Thermoanaerobaculia bacterium]
MQRPAPAPKIFLLSPASATGIRARQLRSRRAGFPAAERLRSLQGLPIAEAFSFMSALYFRGKIAYARRFAAAPPEMPAILVIAPGFGLVPPDWGLTVERLRKLARTPVDLSSRAYVRPLRQQARELGERLSPTARVILLGSIATGKYRDLLSPILGERLLYPRAFLGAGDMQRGSMMLRAALAGVELEYTPCEAQWQRRKPQQDRAAPASSSGDR